MTNDRHYLGSAPVPVSPLPVLEVLVPVLPVLKLILYPTFLIYKKNNFTILWRVENTNDGLYVGMRRMKIMISR